MENRYQKKACLVRTPVHQIPIGEPVFSEDGRPGLRIKKQGTPLCEIIWLDQIYGIVFTTTAS